MGNTPTDRRRSRHHRAPTRRTPAAVVLLVVAVAVAAGVYLATSRSGSGVLAGVTSDTVAGTPEGLAARVEAELRALPTSEWFGEHDQDRIVDLYMGMPKRLEALAVAIDRGDVEGERRQRAALAGDFRELEAIAGRARDPGVPTSR